MKHIGRIIDCAMFGFVVCMAAWAGLKVAGAL